MHEQADGKRSRSHRRHSRCSTSVSGNVNSTDGDGSGSRGSNINYDNFINNLLEFEVRNVTLKIREKLESNDYLGQDGVDEAAQLTIASVSKANRVAGCLVRLLEAQLQCNEFLLKVELELIGPLTELKN